MKPVDQARPVAFRFTFSNHPPASPATPRRYSSVLPRSLRDKTQKQFTSVESIILPIKQHAVLFSF